MNTNFYAIEIASTAHDERFMNDIRQARLAEAAHSGRTTLLESIIHLLLHAL